MSTNYYMKFKIIKEVQANLNDKMNSSTLDFEIDVLKNITKHLSYLDNEAHWLHIGKRSCGWKPTFHKNNYWSSVEEILDFYRKNKESILIIDEYNRELSIEELKENLIDWNKDNKKALTPFDEESQFNEHWLKNYYKDNDGYIFTTDDFS